MCLQSLNSVAPKDIVKANLYFGMFQPSWVICQSSYFWGIELHRQLFGNMTN